MVGKNYSVWRFGTLLGKFCSPFVRPVAFCRDVSPRRLSSGGGPPGRLSSADGPPERPSSGDGPPGRLYSRLAHPHGDCRTRSARCHVCDLTTEATRVTIGSHPSPRTGCRRHARNQGGALHPEAVRRKLSVGHEVKREIPVGPVRGLEHAIEITPLKDSTSPERERTAYRFSRKRNSQKSSTPL